MRADEFELLLGLLSRLTVEQKDRLRVSLAAGDQEAAVVELLESRLGADPCCVHCGAERVLRWGFSHGLQRFRCQDCRRSFNALTGTPLARLRKKASWLIFAETLSEGLSVKAAAERCSVAPSTSFRWRHRFLQAKTADSEALSGIVEADETFFRLSYKGSRRWRSGQNPPDRSAKKRGSKAQKRGLSHEQVPVLVTRDRSGSTRACVLENRSAGAIEAAIGAVLPKDGILCSDAWDAFGVVARKHDIRHEPINLSAGERVRENIWHFQNANAHHSRLKDWVRDFKGVATRYLPNYLAWHHGSERYRGKNDHASWIRLAINS